MFFGPNQFIFPPKQVPCRFSLNLPLFGLGPSSKGLGTNLKLLTTQIAWIHWSSDLAPLSKVALRLYKPLLRPLGSEKVLGFKRSGSQLKLLLDLCQWAWLGGANGLSGWVAVVLPPETQIPLRSIRQLLGSRLHVSFLQHFLVLWLPWFGGKKQPCNYQCWVGRTLAYRLLLLLLVSSESGKFGPFLHENILCIAWNHIFQV